MEELEKRIRSRGTETPAQIETRLGKAGAELKLLREYDYVIVNENVDEVVCKIETIMTAEKLKVSRYEDKLDEQRSESL